MSGLLLLCFFLSDVRAASPQDLFREPGGKEPVAIVDLAGVRFSRQPDCSKHKCDAYRAAQKAPENFRRAGIGNPASELCAKLLGTPDIFFLRDGSNVSICRFHDGSFFLGWDLLRK